MANAELDALVERLRQHRRLLVEGGTNASQLRADLEVAAELVETLAIGSSAFELFSGQMADALYVTDHEGSQPRTDIPTVICDRTWYIEQLRLAWDAAIRSQRRELRLQREHAPRPVPTQPSCWATCERAACLEARRCVYV